MTANLVETAGLHAAYAALQPYTQHAQVRADLAERIVTALRDYSPFAVVEVLLDNWPSGYTRISRDALSQVVTAARRAMTETEIETED